MSAAPEKMQSIQLRWPVPSARMTANPRYDAQLDSPFHEQIARVFEMFGKVCGK
jgi:hypothetical protein